MMSCVRQNADKQKPEQNQQVHDQEDASDPGFAGFGRAGADVVEIVTAPEKGFYETCDGIGR